MKRIFIIVLIVFFSLNLIGQTRLITGMVISEEFMDILPQTKIMTIDSVLLGMSDRDGRFEIALPNDINSLLFITSTCCYENRIIKVSSDCDHFDVIIMPHTIYDYISIRKVNKLRKKRFDNLLEIHKEAFEKGIFITESPCYTSEFVAQ